MSERTKAIIIAGACAAILLCVVSGLLGWRIGKGRKEYITKRDTVVNVVTYRDTVKVVEPKYLTKEVVRKELVYLKDTIRVHDSMFVYLPVERVEYVDTNYYAVVSGVQPKLEEISVYPKTTVVTNTVTETVYEKRKPTRFGIGIQAGFGGMYGLKSKKIDAGPYIGVGISYNLIRF